MSPRTRILALIGVAAVVVVAAVVLVAAGGDGGSDNGRSAARKGLPPLALDLGLRTDAQAEELRRAAALYNVRKQAPAAGRIFDRYSSPEAQVGSAFAAWPDGTVASLEGLAERYPRSSLVLLNLGLARFWSGDNRGAAQAWLDAYEAQPDTPSSLTADHLLNPNTPKGQPVFIPSFHVPPLNHLDTAAKLAALQRAARKPDVRARIVYGIALQLLGRERSAERAYASAARLAPNDPEPQVAVAVSRFTRTQPARAFSRLGPLTKRFPKAPTVRFHLGLLLAYRGDIAAAEEQFRKARAIDPVDPLAREARHWLAEFQQAHTGRTQAP